MKNKTDKKNFRYLFTGGGTAGHVYPGLALAEFIQGQDPDAQFLFVGAKAGAEERIVPSFGFDLSTLDVKGLPSRKALFQYFKVLLRLTVALGRAAGILFRFKPHVIIGTGGYASAPVLLAALFFRYLGLWKGILALHEQNIVPGRFNQWMARWVDFTGTSFPDTLRFFPHQKAYWTGYPLRKGMERSSLVQAEKRERERRDLKIPPTAKVILVFGGSSGARTINRMLLDSLPALLEKDDIHVFHAVGYPQGSYKPEEEIQEALTRLPDTEAYIRKYQWKPYYEKLETYYRISDLIIGRSGAGSVWEIASANKPSILIPKSNLPGDHQVKNARFLERNGPACVLYEKKGEPLTRGAPETVDPEVFVKGVTSILYGQDRQTIRNKEMDIPAAADRFYDVMQFFLAPKRDETGKALNRNTFQFKEKNNIRESGLEWNSGTSLLSFLDKKWRQKEEIPEEDRKYLESKIDHLLCSPGWEQRNLGVKLSGLIRYHQRLPFLLHCISDRTPAAWFHRLLGGDFREVGFIRRNALQAVWRISVYDAGVREALIKALSDPYFEVRSWAGRAVSRLSDAIVQDREIETLLRRNMKDRWFEVVVFSLEPLGKISHDPELLSELLPLLEHKNWKVQEAVVRCLMQLLDRNVIRLPEEVVKRMRKIPMKGLDFSPQFPLEKTWESFQHQRSKPLDSNHSSDS